MEESRKKKKIRVTFPQNIELRGKDLKQKCMRKMLLLKRAKDLFLLSVLINFNLSAQISEGGSPLFLSKAKSTPSIPVARLPKINNDSLLLRDMQQENYLKGFNFAAAIHTEYDTQNSGIWIESNNGGQIWLLRVESENAGSLNFVLNYQLEPGAKLFIYNPETGKTLGAYTSANNKPWGRLAVQPIRGNKAIFEYHVPKGVSQGILGIKTVGHGYLKAYNPYFDREYNDFGRSKECQPDINGPQGQGWQNEKRSVVKIVAQLDQHTFSSFSGVLVNNTAQDQTPYILTCEHGINGWSNDPDYTPATGAQNSIYFFNYESPEPGVDGGQSQSISGAILRATKPDLDFALLELSVSVPENYTPYFAGWDRRKLELEFAVGISHPMGDVKKIAKTKSPVIPDETFNPDYPYRLNTHYEIVGWDYGSLEGGSSGSPMFSPEAHRVTSILSGGSSKDCGEQHIERNTYQMLYYCWADTEVESQQLKHWLDPVDLGVEFIDGFGPYDTDKVYFWPDRDLCYLNEPIIFSDHSIGEYNNYRWNFGESAVPQTATGKNPVTVSYTEVGVYTASLTVTNKDGQDETFSLENYIEVFYRAPVAGFEVSNRVVSLGDNTTFTNLSTGIIMSYEWDFDEGAEPRTLETTSTDPVTVAYTTPGFKRIKLTAINPSGSDTKQYTLLVNEDITASFTIEPGPYFTGDTVHMESAEDKWAEDGYNCFWSINGEKASQDKELTFSNSFNTSGKHTISFNVSSPLEIKDEKAIEIEVVDHIQTTPSISVDNATIICNVENGKNDESYFWDFGDGNTSTEEAPSHEYTEAGIYAVTLTVSNPYEEISITKDCVIDIVLGINDGEINNGAELKIYPNPATEYFTVKFPKSREVTNIQLFSATGTLVYFKQTQDSDLKVNCNDLAPGFYLVVVQVGKNQKITRKIIVS